MKALIKGSIQHHTEETFWSAFLDNLRCAQSLIIIACPYIRRRRLDKLLPEFEALRDRGVQVCVFLQDPASWNTASEYDDDFAPPENPQQSIEEFNELVTKLQSKNVHVMLRRHSHQKIVIIDGTTTWFGSLNVLSHTGMTYEHMTKIDCAETAAWMVGAHRLNCPECKEKFEKPLVWFGQQFKKCRNSAGLTQIQLGEILKIDQTAVSRIESGERNLTVDLLVAYTNQMGWDINFLPGALGNSKTTSNISPSRKTIGQQLRKARLSRRLSRETLAHSAGLSRTGLSNIEKGNTNSNLSILLAIATACGHVIVLNPIAAETSYANFSVPVPVS